MAENPSQAGSLRAGYRRSRVEPIDPATIQAPPPKSVSPNGSFKGRSVSQASLDDSNNSKKEGVAKKVVRILFVIKNIIILFFGILMIISGATLWYIFSGSGLSIFEVAGGAAITLILNGIFLVLFAGWGFDIAFGVAGKGKVIAYLVALVVLLVVGSLSYIKSNRIGTAIYDNLIQYWGTMNANTRSKIQDFGYCCGLHGPIDYPALPCPNGTLKGCARAYQDMQLGIQKIATGFFAGNVIFFVLLGLGACVLGFAGQSSGDEEVEPNKSTNKPTTTSPSASKPEQV